MRRIEAVAPRRDQHARTRGSESQRRSLAAALIIAVALIADAPAQLPWLPLVNHNPLLQGYAIPGFDGATLASPDTSGIGLRLTLVNHADNDAAQGEVVVLDGESIFAELSLRRAISDRVELSVTLPLVRHSSGHFDDAIEAWHDLVGLSDSDRDGPSNQLLFAYVGPAGAELSRRSGTAGLGDVRVSAAFALPLHHDSRFRSSLRIHCDLPTGDGDRLLGNEATDFGLGLHADYMASARLALTAFAGVAYPGDGGWIRTGLRERIGYAGAGLAWQPSRRLHWLVQLRVNEPIVHSALETLGGSAAQLAFGAQLETRSGRGQWAFALVEDVFDDSTPDVAFHVGFRSRRSR